MKTKISIRLLTMALATLFTTALVAQASATDEKPGIPVELKFVGNLKAEPLFHLVFDSPDETEYTITVRDVYGNVYYKENVKGSKFIKKFLVKTDDLNEGELRFEVSSKSYDKPVVFEINSRTQFVQDVVVNKLKG